MRKLVCFLALAMFLANCKKNPDGEDNPIIIEKPVLSFPAQNEACTSGTIVSIAQSAIVFKWQKAANADSYELFVKNLLTNQIAKKSTSGLEQEMILDRNTPYSWYVVSKSQTITDLTQSDVWKFYNAGPGTVSYAPFPAEIISPLMASTMEAINNKISLEWKGEDVDNDILGYDVYFSSNSTLSLIKSNLKETTLKDLDVKSKNTYYWKVITKDSNGNSSDSGTFQFMVK
ncbi:hypothetical protein HDC90_003604 [Pedobacter sp. AK013]|uniref:hypothetical protein n=1 Tax=Pedobacter sp. AK013 TaxID=2723071 RepID=UPI001616B543|nr:hypothetical protein [Pedobacter sp. AK013]MBB6238957.1 hypothetical protein [Pedobacter sp. AK013]